MKKKLVSIILSIMVAVTFMPLAAEYTFAAEGDQSQNMEQPEQVETPPPRFNPANAVRGIRVTGYNYKSVTLSWNKVDQATGYQIYRATKKNGKYKKIKTTSAHSFYDGGNKTLGKYKYYKIRAYGVVGGKTVYGTYSSKFCAKPNMPAPIVTTTSASGKVNLSWSKVAGATKYKVYRATSRNGKYSSVKTTKSCSFSNKVTNGKRYYYKVRPYRKSKGGITSGIVEGIATLAAPADVTAVCNEGVITVSWKAVGQSAFYQVFRSTDSDSGYVQIGENTTDLSLQDSSADLEEGTEYFYKVRAVASVNGRDQPGSFSTGGGRDRMMNQALSWYGKKEGDKSNKVIVSAFNSRMGTSFSYTTPWCAIFVSACAIESGNASVIPLSASCPTMVSKFKSWSRWNDSKTYLPERGDVIFYDWAAHNNVADHVGLIVSSNSSTKKITAIEGNTRGSERSKFSSDAVAYRYYNAGYSDVLGYGLPKYSQDASVTYAKLPIEDPVETEIVAEATEAALGAQETDVVSEPVPESEAVETKEITAEETSAEEPAVIAEEPAVTTEEPAAEPETDMNKVMNLVEFIEEEQPAEESAASEEAYDAFLVMNVCEELDIDACVLVTTDENGNQIIWNELELDGQTYTLYPSEEGCTPEVLNPEKAN